MSDIEHEQTAPRDEIGTYFRDFGDDFKLEGAARVEVGDDVVSVNPPTDVEFAVAIEDTDEGDGEQRRLTFELAWEKTEYDEELQG